MAFRSKEYVSVWVPCHFLVIEWQTHWYLSSPEDFGIYLPYLGNAVGHMYESRASVLDNRALVPVLRVCNARFSSQPSLSVSIRL